MAVDYDDTIKTSRMEVVRDALDTGSTLEVCTAAYADVLIVYALDDPAAEVIGDTLMFNGLPINGNPIADGIAAVARVKNGNGDVKINALEVGVEVILANTTVAVGTPVALTAGSFTHA